MFFIKIYSIRAQESFQFIFERLLPMMLFLITNVFSHTLDLRLTDREGTETSLPTEPAICFVCRFAQPEEPDFNLLRNSDTEIVGRTFAST